MMHTKLQDYQKKSVQDNMNERLIANVNENIIDFRDSLKNRSEREIQEKLEIYVTARKKLNKTVINNEYKRWATVIANKDSTKTMVND